MTHEPIALRTDAGFRPRSRMPRRQVWWPRRRNRSSRPGRENVQIEEEHGRSGADHRTNARDAVRWSCCRTARPSAIWLEGGGDRGCLAFIQRLWRMSDYCLVRTIRVRIKHSTATAQTIASVAANIEALTFNKGSPTSMSGQCDREGRAFRQPGHATRTMLRCSRRWCRISQDSWRTRQRR